MLKYRFIPQKKADEKFGGSPCELVNTNLSTYRQVIQYYYFLTHINPSTDFLSIVQQIGRALKFTWSNVNPRLPLLMNECLYIKIKNLLALVRYINRKHSKSRTKSNLDAKLDKLFDISACTCPLEILPCSDRRVNCMIEICVQEHIACICPENARVPIEDRAYLRAQRLKTGPKEVYHLSSIKQATAKRDRRAKTEQQQGLSQETVELVEYSEVPIEPPGHTSNFFNNKRVDTCKPRKMPSDDFIILKLPRYTMELVRSNCTSNLGTSLANALLHDIKHLLRPEVDINRIVIDKSKLDLAKGQVKGLCEDAELRESIQFIDVGMDQRDDQKALTYKGIQLTNKECAIKNLPHIDITVGITNTECPNYVLDNIKSEVEVKEEVVDDCFEASSEDFVQDMQEEYVSSVQNSSNSSSSCDAFSSTSATEASLIDLCLSSKSGKPSGNSTGFHLFMPENTASRRRQRRGILLNPEKRYQRIREINNEASSRYRAKKKLEREGLEQMLRNEQERNDRLMHKFKSLTKEASVIESVLETYKLPKRITPSYSSN